MLFIDMITRFVFRHCMIWLAIAYSWISSVVLHESSAACQSLCSCFVLEQLNRMQSGVAFNLGAPVRCVCFMAFVAMSWHKGVEYCVC
jgi:hypothetical protein